MARLGFKGGLKKIEPRFGIHRPKEVNGMDGYMAVLLWQRYQRGDQGALDLLLTYNREDVVNLEVLMDGGLPDGAGAAPGRPAPAITRPAAARMSPGQYVTGASKGCLA